MPMQGYQQIDPQAFSNILKGIGAIFGKGDLRATIPSADGVEGTGEGQPMSQVYGANPGLKFETTGGDFWDRVYGRQAMQANNQLALGQYGNNMMLANDETLRGRTTRDLVQRETFRTNEGVRGKELEAGANRRIKQGDLEHQDAMAMSNSPSVRYYGTGQQQALRAQALLAGDQASLLGTGLPYAANLYEVSHKPQLMQSQLDHANAQTEQLKAQADQIRAEINNNASLSPTQRAHLEAQIRNLDAMAANVANGHYAALPGAPGWRMNTRTGEVEQFGVPTVYGRGTLPGTDIPFGKGINGVSPMGPNAPTVSPYGAGGVIPANRMQ